MAAGARERLVADLDELALSTQRAGGANPIALFNLAGIIAGDLQKKEVPEAYLMYALYDSDSNRYEVGKKVLTRNAANQHEILEEEMYIAKDGYMETFVVNATSEDVWFDNLMVMSVSSVIVQETHFDPWGLELTGLEYQYGGIKKNKYLYQGKEWMDDLNLNIYDFHARGYDPAIGRTLQIDPGSESYYPMSPYSWVMNNPLKFIDPTGMFADYFDMNGQFLGSDNVDDKEIRILNVEKNAVPEGFYKSDFKTVHRETGMFSSKGMKDSPNLETAKFGIVNHYYEQAGFDLSELSQGSIVSETDRGRLASARYGHQWGLGEDGIQISFNYSSLGREFQNGYDIINEFIHERGGHIEEFKSLLSNNSNYRYDYKSQYWEREKYAVSKQITHSSWGKTSPEWKMRILDVYNPILNSVQTTKYFNRYGIR